MSIKYVNLREFRQNMAKISNEARKKRQRVVVLKRNLPIFELTPILGDDEGLYNEAFISGLVESMKQADKKRTTTLAKAKKDLGL